MKIERTIVLNAAIERVWDILASDYTRVGEWTTAINSSAPVDGEPLPGAPAYGRVCDTPGGRFQERITDFDPQQRVLAYTVEEGLPFFVRRGGNTWRLSALSGGRTQVSMKMEFVMPAPVEWIVGGMMRGQMGKAADVVAEDLRAYAESGTISAKKRARA